MNMIKRGGMNDDFYYVLEAELKRRRESATRVLLERERMAMPEEVPF